MSHFCLPLRTRVLETFSAPIQNDPANINNHPLLLDRSLEDAVVAKGPLRRRCMANSLRISPISSISLEPVFTSAMSSIFPLRASCAFVSNCERQSLWWSEIGFTCPSEPGMPGRNCNCAAFEKACACMSSVATRPAIPDADKIMATMMN